jgi:uncharacterized protein (TIGR03435 family)
MRPFLGILLVWLGFSSVARAQAGPGPEFEVASVKMAPQFNGRPPFPIPSMAGGPGTGAPTRFTVRNYFLLNLITYAYSLHESRLSGPAWLKSNDPFSGDRFDIDATVPPGSTKEQLLAMLRNLLANRFGLKVHREQREMQVYDLVVGKDGPRLKENREAAIAGESHPPLGAPGADGFPVMPSGYTGIFVKASEHSARVKYLRYPMGKFAEWLSGILNRPVPDRTGLTGSYDFQLEYRMDAAAGIDAPEGELPDIFRAVEFELGLKLVGGKGAVEVLVIDHVERVPSGN